MMAPSPKKPSCVTFRPASSFANASFSFRVQSSLWQVRPYSIPAIKVSPAPIVLRVVRTSRSQRRVHCAYSTTARPLDTQASLYSSFPLLSSRAAAPSSPQVQHSSELIIESATLGPYGHIRRNAYAFSVVEA